MVPGPVPPLVLDGVVVIGGESLARLLLLRGVREVVVVEVGARVFLPRGGTVPRPDVAVGVTGTETGKGATTTIAGEAETGRGRGLDRPVGDPMITMAAVAVAGSGIPRATQDATATLISAVG